MRALSLTGPGTAELVDAAAPEAGDGEVLVAPRWVGLCGTDLELYLGTMPYFGQGVASYPIQPGHEVAGVLVGGANDGTPVLIDPVVGCGVCPACAAGVETRCAARRELGIRLGMAGGAAELIAVPARKLHQVPDGVALRDAVLVEPGVTAMNAVERVGDVAGARALVIGAGTLGLLATQLLVARGADVDVLVVDASRDAIVSDAGARTVTEGASDAYPIVFEAAGTPGAVRTALDAAAPGGHVALMGVQQGLVDELDVNQLVLGDVTLFGVLNGPGLYDRMLAEIAAGRVRPGALIDSEFPLADVEAAIARLRDPTRTAPKVLLRIATDGGDG